MALSCFEFNCNTWLSAIADEPICSDQGSSAQPSLARAYAMAPHLSPAELDFIYAQDQKGKTPGQIRELLATRRARQNIACPHLTNFRKAIKGLTFKRGRKETRGRKAKYSKKWVKTMDAVRKQLLKKAKTEREIRWRDVVKSARAPRGHRTTVLRSFRRDGIKVAARKPREKPQRTPVHERERVDYCKSWAHKPRSFFVRDLDMIIDNKNFDVPTTERARSYLKQQRVRFHLRTPAEGLQAECTKPGRKKNKMNTGAVAKVCAGISNGRVVLWEYLPKTWNGEEAASLYAGAIYKTLQKHRGQKRKYRILEDNDPTGYKSGKAIAKKAELGIEAFPLPRYSPDLNPLDFSVWDAIEARMMKGAPAAVETVAAYKKRLRLTALRLPARVVSKAVGDIPKRMQAIVDARGKNVACD